MNIMQIVALIRSILPAMQIVAEAFRFGVDKHGSDSWKNLSASEHVQKAMEAISQSSTSTRRCSLLADAALRLLFALCLSIGTTKKYEPKPTDLKS
jgi:hypothetical protein